MKLEWMGRAVVCGEFDIRKGREVRAAFAEDGETGSYACLVASLRYADDNMLVFQSVDEVLAQPFRLGQRLLRLAGEAAKVNGFFDDDEHATNGSGEPIGETGEGESTSTREGTRGPPH